MKYLRLYITKDMQDILCENWRLLLGKIKAWKERNSFFIFFLQFIRLIIVNCLLLLLSRQSCPILCDPIDGNPPGSSFPGILQARILELVAISFSNAWKWKVKVKSLSCVWLLGTLWTAGYQAPPSMGFYRQEYWSGLPLLSPT